MREFIIDNTKHVMRILLLVARLADIISTYLATPTLQLESNPLAKRLGWPFIVMSVFACAIPYWSVSISMVALVVSLWVSADNIGRLWFIRALGETEYHDMVRRAKNRGSLLGRFIVFFSKAVCITAMGVILCFLTYTSPQLPLSFWFGVGILAYAFLNLFIGSLRFYKMVNHNTRTISEQPAGGDGVNATSQP